MTSYAAFGTQLQMDDGSLNYTTVAQVQDITAPQISVDTEDATTHASTGAWEEALPTIIRSGTVDFTILFDPNTATHGTSAGLLQVIMGRLKRSWKVILPTSPTKTWAFQGFVTAFNGKEEVAGLQQADISVKITGQMSLT